MQSNSESAPLFDWMCVHPTPSACVANFSGSLVSLSTSCSTPGSSLVSGLHPWWHSPTRRSPTWLFTPPPLWSAGPSLGEGAMPGFYWIVLIVINCIDELDWLIARLCLMHVFVKVFFIVRMCWCVFVCVLLPGTLLLWRCSMDTQAPAVVFWLHLWLLVCYFSLLVTSCFFYSSWYVVYHAYSGVFE